MSNEGNRSHHTHWFLFFPPDQSLALTPFLTINLMHLVITPPLSPFCIPSSFIETPPQTTQIWVGFLPLLFCAPLISLLLVLCPSSPPVPAEQGADI